jgi:hypothetical protein
MRILEREKTIENETKSRSKHDGIQNVESSLFAELLFSAVSMIYWSSHYFRKVDNSTYIGKMIYLTTITILYRSTTMLVYIYIGKRNMYDGIAVET